MRQRTTRRHMSGSSRYPDPPVPQPAVHAVKATLLRRGPVALTALDDVTAGLTRGRCTTRRRPAMSARWCPRPYWHRLDAAGRRTISHVYFKACVLEASTENVARDAGCLLPASKSA
jgi:hypothetical protein